MNELPLTGVNSHGPFMYPVFTVVKIFFGESLIVKMLRW